MCIRDSYYAHLYTYERDFQVGDAVKAGEVLGLMGDSGYGDEGTTGQFPVHLHFGIYFNTEDGREISVNPYSVLRVLEGNRKVHALAGRGNSLHCSTTYVIPVSYTHLDILNKSNDGFYIAEEDLKLRGPGDLFGIRQSGIADFQIADIYQDADLLKESSAAVREILELDPELKLPQNRLLNEALEHYLERQNADILL